METFEAFLSRREAVSSDYINGDFGSLAEISTTDDPASFLPPDGTSIVGAAAVNRANREGAARFCEGSSGHFETLNTASSGDIGFWTGLQHASVMLAGQKTPVQMKLRVTEVFRRESGAWKLIHRHADRAKD